MDLLLFFLLHVFRTDPPIVVARDTTYIAEPLQADGSPDYEAYLRDLGREGVTPNNNAAVPMWQALWPHNLEQEDYEPMRRELGLKEMPPSKDTLRPLDGEAIQKRVTEWLHLDTDEIDPNDVIWPAIDHSWTSVQCPPLAEWVASNKRPLNLLVEASHRPRFYSPSPSFLNRKPDLLISILLPGSQNMREASRALGVRAMWHVGENRMNDAWTDIMALHRLARLAAQGQTLVDQLIAVAMSEAACRGTLALVSNERMPLKLAQRIKNDLDGLPRICHVAERLNTMERMCALDAVIHLKRNGILHGLVAVAGDEPEGRPNFTRPIPFDANIVMRRVNKWYDRLVTIAKMPRKSRKETFSKFWDDLDADRERIKRPTRWIAATFSLNARSESIGAIIVNLLLPALDAAKVAEDRAHATLDLTQLCVALSVYRAQHQNYPVKLEDLVPAVVQKLPADPYNGKSFVYKRSDNGYLLYSAGENGEDDGGNNEIMQLLAGRSLKDLGNTELEQLPEIPDGSDDISVRVPRPKFQLPKIGQPGAN